MPWLQDMKIAVCTYICCAGRSYPEIGTIFESDLYVDPDKSNGKRRQKIHILYDLIGFISMDVLLKAEQA